jgi:hypothetical protein
MVSSKTQRLERIYDKLAFLDFFTFFFIILNILDMLSTVVGISSGKGEETNIILVEILDSYGIIALTLVKVCLSLVLLIPLFIKYYWKANIYTKSVTIGVGIVSVSLLPIYLYVVIHNISILL